MYNIVGNGRKYPHHMYEIDKTDIKIINLLMEDGRMPASEMARRIGAISERVVRYRIERIVKEGVHSDKCNNQP